MPFTVPVTDIDELEHVNNAIYVSYIELVSRAHPESLGFDTDAFIALGGVFVVRRHEIDYLAPALAGDTLRLVTWIEEYKGPRTWRHVEICRGDTVLVRSKTEWVWIDPATRMPKRIPAKIIETLKIVQVAS